MSTVAVMQPYFFPYLGYWQLIEAADRFVVLDDVNYINRGWVNRNRILVNSAPSYITVPLSQASQNKYICDLRLQASPVWRSKMLKSIELAYRRSACFDEVFPVVEQLISHEVENLSDYLTYQLQSLAAFMGINTEFVPSSRCYANRHLSGQQRIIDICRIEGAHTYINLPGGRELYDAAAFDASGLALSFISMIPCFYRQRSAGFVQNLSIIDLLMACGAENVKSYLRSYELLSPLASS